MVAAQNTMSRGMVQMQVPKAYANQASSFTLCLLKSMYGVTCHHRRSMVACHVGGGDNMVDKIRWRDTRIRGRWAIGRNDSSDFPLSK